MANFNQYELIDIIEEFASMNGLVESEEDLSERFDDSFKEVLEDLYEKDDEVAISEMFNNWSDSLCKDGELHELQYNNYCYVGKYS